MKAPIFKQTLTSEQARAIPMQSLSFIGDAVQTLATRTEIVFRTDAKGGKMHALTSSTVKATYQAQMVDELRETFSDEELEIYKKGRNAQTKNIAKNSTANEYHKASGLEALIGYLYLCGREERLTELLEYITKDY